MTMSQRSGILGALSNHYIFFFGSALVPIGRSVEPFVNTASCSCPSAPNGNCMISLISSISLMETRVDAMDVSTVLHLFTPGSPEVPAVRPLPEGHLSLAYYS